MKRGIALKKKIALLLLCVMLTGLCACRTKAPQSSAEDSGSVGAYIDESGTIVYTFGDPDESSRDDGTLIHRSPEAATDIPEGSISPDQAADVLDSCSFEKFYLPCSTSSFLKYYEGSEKVGKTEYLVFSFYAEKNGVRLFAGTHALVSTDGNTVMKENWAGSYEPVEKEAAARTRPNRSCIPMQRYHRLRRCSLYAARIKKSSVLRKA